VSDIQKESQVVLDSIKEQSMTSTAILKREENDGIAVYVLKETILKEIAAKIKLRQHFFYGHSPGTSRYTSYTHCVS
jgi:hypothetical protein